MKQVRLQDSVPPFSHVLSRDAFDRKRLRSLRMGPSDKAARGAQGSFSPALSKSFFTLQNQYGITWVQNANSSPTASVNTYLLVLLVHVEPQALDVPLRTETRLIERIKQESKTKSGNTQTKANNDQQIETWDHNQSKRPI